MKFLKSNAMILLALVSEMAFSGVNLKNGNFYVSYTDIVVPGTGKSLEMTRTYNSKSTEKGWFGFGWGNVYETKLVKSPDGCVVVHEHGAGGSTRFCPKNPVDPKKAAQKIVDAMRKRSKSGITGTAEKNLMDRLVNNAELRNVYARKFGVESKIAKGSVLYSNQRGIQEVHVTKSGFFRKSNDGKVEYFNPEGNLYLIEGKNNQKIELTYKNKTLYSIKDLEKRIYLKWYSNGKIQEMWSAKDKIASFKYNGDDLIYSKDVGGNEYGYEYDNNHNLTKVVYNPNRKKADKEDAMKLEYEPKTFFISKITDRNGDTTEYKYGSNPKNPKDHYWTDVTKKGFNNKLVTNRYEYEIKTRPDGSRYTYRIMTRVNGIQTETIYTECCGLPQKIARGDVVTNFKYNDKGLLKEKRSTRGDYVKIDYDKVHNKISKVVNNSGTTTFEYDKKGNLKEAKNSKGKAVLLIYNNKGKIQKMVDKDVKTKERRILSFKYNSLGKPVQIEMEKVGKINVAYDNYGEIKRVESKQGHKMALQVTQAFQNLLAIVKPAGVNLNL